MLDKSTVNQIKSHTVQILVTCKSHEALQEMQAGRIPFIYFTAVNNHYYFTTQFFAFKHWQI